MISNELISLIRSSKRPIFIWGAGMRSCAAKARELAHYLQIPVACTWGAVDLLHHDDTLMCGGFGTHGTRASNFAVQNSDLVISLGSRLDTKATGQPCHFARGARLVMVDIDRAELDKFAKLGRTIDFPICDEAHNFLLHLRRVSQPVDTRDWLERIADWKERYNVIPNMPGQVNPYRLMQDIGKWTGPGDIIVSDTGTSIGYICQAFPFKGERLLHAFNMTPMGYGMAGAVGAAFAAPKSRIIAIVGDGGAMMSLPELATIARHNLNVKVILLDNKGHAMCRQTQRQWLGGHYYSTSIEGGLGFPDWNKVAQSFGFKVKDNVQDLFLFEMTTRLFCAVDIHPDCQLVPQARFGQPLEDADPQLPREEFRKQMIVEPL